MIGSNSSCNNKDIKSFEITRPSSRRRQKWGEGNGVRTYGHMVHRVVVCSCVFIDKENGNEWATVALESWCSGALSWLDCKTREKGREMRRVGHGCPSDKTRR